MQQAAPIEAPQAAPIGRGGGTRGGGTCWCCTGLPLQPVAAAPAANRGVQLLGEAQALFKNGNYPAAKQLATQAKEGKFGVDAQADELIAQAEACRARRCLEPLRDGTGGACARATTAGHGSC